MSDHRLPVTHQHILRTLAAMAFVVCAADVASACMQAGTCGGCPPATLILSATPIWKYFQLGFSLKPTVAAIPLLGLSLMATALAIRWRWFVPSALNAFAAAFVACAQPKWGYFTSWHGTSCPERIPDIIHYSVAAVGLFGVTTIGYGLAAYFAACDRERLEQSRTAFAARQHREA
jgi:hypothetical protein